MAAKKKAVSNIESRLSALRRDFEALQDDIKGLAGDVGSAASERATLAMRSAEDVADRAMRLAEEAAREAKVAASEFADEAGEWAEENAETLRTQVREQPITSLLIAGGVGAFLGAIFLRRWRPILVIPLLRIRWRKLAPVGLSDWGFHACAFGRQSGIAGGRPGDGFFRRRPSGHCACHQPCRPIRNSGGLCHRGRHIAVAALFLGYRACWPSSPQTAAATQPSSSLMAALMAAVAKETPWIAVIGAGLAGAADMFLNRNKPKK